MRSYTTAHAEVHERKERERLFFQSLCLRGCSDISFLLLSFFSSLCSFLPLAEKLKFFSHCRKNKPTVTRPNISLSLCFTSAFLSLYMCPSLFVSLLYFLFSLFLFHLFFVPLVFMSQHFQLSISSAVTA